MKNYHQLTGQKKAKYIALSVIIHFLLLFGQLGKTIKLFGTKKRQLLASVLILVMILTMLPIGAFRAFAVGTNVAEIGGVGYTSLQTAFNSVTNGQTVKLLGNITVTDGTSFTFSGSNSFTLDLNGKTMSGGSGFYSFVSNTGAGTLTVADSATGGIITSSRSNGNSSGTIDLYTGNGSLIIAGGTVENTSSTTSVAICNRGTGTVSIQNGTVRALHYCIENYANGKAVVSGGILENGMIGK